MSAAAPAPQRWLHGPGSDLLLGCGVGYALLIVVALVATDGEIPTGVLLPLTALVALFVNTPHYGATLLRVYEQREDRRKYALFAVHATILLWAAFVGGVYSFALGSLLLTLYVTWSPWHFSGQNYGIALMFLHRRGVPVPPGVKRLIYVSFLLSYALTLFAAHGEKPTLGFAQVPDYSSLAYRFLALGIPSSVSAVALPLVAGAYVATVLAAVAGLRRGGSWRDLAPTLLLLGSQALWFCVPALLFHFGVLLPKQWVLASIWVGATHSLQYLWVTSYYARRADPDERLGGYLTKTLLAGAVITIFPALLFAPGMLGTVTYGGGLAVLLFSVVNLHHFVLDGAVWKLRDGRVARALLRSAGTGAEPVGEVTPERAWVRPLVWVVGAACVAVALVHVGAGVQYRRALDRNDVASIVSAARAMSWIGRDNALVRLNLGRRIVATSGDRVAARAEIERSLALQPSAEAWTTLGWLVSQDGDWQGALDAYDAALALEPEHAQALRHAVAAALQLRRPERARAYLERALAASPDAPDLKRALHALDAVSPPAAPARDRARTSPRY